MLSITKLIEFEAAHRISNYPGSCQYVHGHTYKLEVSVSAKVNPQTDMIMDFKDLKKILQSSVLDPLDHALILKNNEENQQYFSSYSGKVTWLNTEPTAEQMLLWIAERIQKQLGSEIKLEQLRLFETSSSFATWKNIKG